MANRYPISVEWSDEDQEYMATCPSFPGLSAFGASEEEAVSEAKVALAGFLKTYEERGLSLPEPPVRSSFSGKLQLRLERTLHRHASQLAEAERVSLNTFIVDAVQAKVAGVFVSRRMIEEVRSVVASGSQLKRRSR